MSRTDVQKSSASLARDNTSRALNELTEMKRRLKPIPEETRQNFKSLVEVLRAQATDEDIHECLRLFAGAARWPGESVIRDRGLYLRVLHENLKEKMYSRFVIEKGLVRALGSHRWPSAADVIAECDKEAQSLKELGKYVWASKHNPAGLAALRLLFGEENAESEEFAQHARIYGVF